MQKLEKKEIPRDVTYKALENIYLGLFQIFKLCPTKTK